jgi:hypothetical protein
MKNNILLDFTKQWAEDPLSLPALLFVYWYFTPYMIAGNSDVDEWVSSVSMNGARWANLCKPNTT